MIQSIIFFLLYFRMDKYEKRKVLKNGQVIKDHKQHIIAYSAKKVTFWTHYVYLVVKK